MVADKSRLRSSRPSRGGGCKCPPLPTLGPRYRLTRSPKQQSNGGLGEGAYPRPQGKGAKESRPRPPPHLSFTFIVIVPAGSGKREEIGSSPGPAEPCSQAEVRSRAGPETPPPNGNQDPPRKGSGPRLSSTPPTPRHQTPLLLEDLHRKKRKAERKKIHFTESHPAVNMSPREPHSNPQATQSAAMK